MELVSDSLTSFWFPEHNREVNVKNVDSIQGCFRYFNLILSKTFIAQALEQFGYQKRNQLRSVRKFSIYHTIKLNLVALGSNKT